MQQLRELLRVLDVQVVEDPDAAYVLYEMVFVCRMPFSR
jgi:hypothetical protein